MTIVNRRQGAAEPDEGATTRREPLVSKRDFLGLEHVAHLAAGGETPFLVSHLEALDRFAHDKSGGMAGRDRIVDVAAEAKDRVAQLLGCQAGDIGFAHNVAEGINMVANSLDFGAGDNVVMEKWEYPSVLYPFLRQRDRGLQVRLLEADDGQRVSLEGVRRAVDERTRAIVLSHVSYFTGERHDLEAYSRIAREAGALLIVDASHAVGAVPVYAPYTDFLFSCCYKWILGTHGATIAYWNRERQPEWRPRELGWASVQWQNAYERGGPLTQVDDGRVFELGNPTFIGLYVLANAVGYILRTGIERIEEHVLGLSGELHRQLAALGLDLLTPEPARERAGNVAFDVGDEMLWRRELEKHGVLTWTSDSRVRFSTHLYNDLTDVERGVAAVTAVLQQTGPDYRTHVTAPPPR